MAMDDALEIVSFTAGGYRFAVEARQVDHQFASAPDAVVAVETLLGLPPASAVRRCWLGVGQHGVEVDGPVDLRSLPVSAIHPLPELVAVRLQLNGVRALAFEAESPLLLVDLRALLA
ncbi:MAG: hypothetical protein P4L87_18075 [Formivibrio sp.]|nr:hypothetical protein [Formivibrio sp.]